MALPLLAPLVFLRVRSAASPPLPPEVLRARRSRYAAEPSVERGGAVAVDLASDSAHFPAMGGVLRRRSILLVDPSAGFKETFDDSGIARIGRYQRVVSALNVKAVGCGQHENSPTGIFNSMIHINAFLNEKVNQFNITISGSLRKRCPTYRGTNLLRR